MRTAAGWAVRRLIPEAEPSAVLPFVMRWGRTRVKALLRRRGLLRGTALVCPQAGRMWAIGQDLVRPVAGEVLVSVEVSAVSPGTERAHFKRLPNARPPFPYFPGYSAAGVVLEAGRGTGLEPGARVALVAPHASLAVARAVQVYPVPADVSLEEAAFVQLGVIALQAVQRADLQLGTRVVVVGQGLVGQILAQLAAAVGADVVASVARSDRRATTPLRRVVKQLITLERDSAGLAGLQAEVTFEATGAPDGVATALVCTGVGGRIVLAGSTRGTTRRFDFGALADRAITVVGAHISSVSPSARTSLARAFLDLLSRRRLDVAPLISERIHPLEAERFYRRLAASDDGVVGAVFCWDRLVPGERACRVWLVTPPDLTPFRGGRMARWPLGWRARRQESGDSA
ncbi:MAG: zinc-binding dehydrogenase [Armatimonadota bacterium]|nr:zinc-binding dehydrogenase [Armatimonadota bacterium]MDR7496603.1 zinc-binding dehydrogenase [Armatimonadota bacterium]